MQYNLRSLNLNLCLVTKELKEIGKNATIIGICQAVFTTIVVDAALIGLHFLIPDKFSLEAAIVLGAIATATVCLLSKLLTNKTEEKKYDDTFEYSKYQALIESPDIAAEFFLYGD